MTIRKVILALRGFDDINSFEDKRVFWNSFINLQKNLPSNVKIMFLLQYRGKESKLYSFLFEPFLEFDLGKKNIPLNLEEYKKYISLKRNGINQLKFSLLETYFISSVCSYLKNKKNKYKYDQLILLNYKLTTLNKSIFIYDNLLPLNKIFLRYSDYIDQGYSTNLIIIPRNFLEIFSKFNDFFLNSISNRNNFFKKYNILGWPLSNKRRKAIHVFKFIVRNYFKNFIVNFLKFIEIYILKFIDIAIFRFILNKVKIFVNIPNLTRENSFVDDSIYQDIFYLKNILPIKPILKYFIYENHLRKETRFISDNDFVNYNDSYIIGRKNFILFLREDFSINEKTIKYELYNLKFKPKFIIFVMKNKTVVYKYFKKTGKFLKEIFFRNKKDKYQNMLSVLFKIKIKYQFNYNPPILILNSLSSFKSCKDISYLNALLQFFIWEDISYVGFIDKSLRKKYSAFPDLYLYSKNHKLYFDKCILNFKLLDELKNTIPLNFISEKNNDILFLNNKKKLF